jgi:hypothetical protein
MIGNEAEIDRLREKAEETLANDDPEGAETFFRSQKHGYRAMTLFRRAGFQLRASSGVYGSLSRAHSSVQQTVSSRGHEGNAPGPLAAKAI